MAVITITADSTDSHLITGISARQDYATGYSSISTSKVKEGKNLSSGDWSNLSPPSVITDEPKLTVFMAWQNSHIDDYYNRIHLIPAKVDVGNLVSDQYFDVVVWNAYFFPRTLESISQSGTSGISFNGPTPPSVWQGLQSKIYQLTVTTDGSPDIDASYLMNWDGSEDDAAITIVGSRIVSLAYPFEAPATETLEWKTNIITSNNGTEQRIRVRKAPRQSYSVKYPLQNNDLRAAENRAYGWLARRWAVPLWSEAQKVSTVGSGLTSIPVDTTTSDYRADSLVYVYESNTVNTTLDIESVTASELNLKRATQSSYVAPWVMPVRIGSVKGAIKKNYFGYQGNLEINFEFTDNLDLGQGSDPEQFLGEDIYFDEILMGEELTDEFIARIDELDFETGRVTRFAPWALNRIRRPFQYILQGMTEIWTFRKWLHRRAGRWKPFWIPSFENNFNLLQTGTVTTSLTVSSDDYKLFANKRSHIALQLVDDSWLTRTITGVTDIGNGQMILAVDTAFTSLTADKIKRICFLGLKRLDTDRVEIKWDTNRTVYCTIPTLEITP